MIDKYLLEDLSLRRDEKGELARWVIQLQADVDTERRKSASLESVIYARDTRIAELEVIRTDAAQVFKEIGYDLGCNPDNESIMMVIDDLKKDNTSLRYQRAGLAREANELEAQAKVWESAATKHLERAEEAEKRLATPVRLPKRWDVSGQVNPPRIVEVQFEQQNRTHDQCDEAIRAAGFTIEGDEQS
ncbi:hypothetical protein [Serratia nevei]|uniref:hypothetical protein n=1 Tax=Serratia nevei TaxID=2703794 RepID=UPI0011F0CADD|nr:hypothetical protein [Serratia nevei]